VPWFNCGTFCEPKESNLGGEADFSTKLKSSACRKSRHACKKCSHFLQIYKMCVPDKSGDFILLCMKILIFAEITLLFPKIKFSSQVGKAHLAN
jgi:hypothetical protein